MNNGIELTVKDIVVSRKRKLILDKLTFSIRPNTLTAIIGPNGAGKTTLMNVLAGEKPDDGKVIINGNNIYDNPEYWLQRIGYVPVDNILHDHLTLEEALIYTGRLRLPNVSATEISSRVNLLLTKFGFPAKDERRNKQLIVLSSGERKRANICSELIVDPPVLMLDEPTSNLDPNAEYNLVSLLATYAHENHKTILLITHTLNTLELCDDVIYIENGELRNFGKHKEVLEQLESDLKISINTNPPESTFIRWARVFEKTITKPEKRKIYKSSKKRRTDNPTIPPPQESKKSIWLYQFWVLLKRHLHVRWGDRWGFFGTLLAGVSGILFFALPGNTFIKPFDVNERVLALNQARQSVYVISLVVTMLGLITSYTEISKEFRIYSHERLKGLSPSAYFFSKWVWLVIAVGIFAPVILIFFFVFIYRQSMPGFPETRIGEVVGLWNQLIDIQLRGFFTSYVIWLVISTLILCCITSVTLGLLISCLTADGGKGYLYLSFTVVFIILFSGLIRNPKLEELIDTLSFLSVGKWSYEGTAASIGLYCWLDDWRFDEFNSIGHILSVWMSLGLYILISIFLSIMLLRLRDPWYSRWKNFKVLIWGNLPRIFLLLSFIVLIFSYAFFLRTLSHEYHALNYWSRTEYGGTGSYQYANVNKSQDLNLDQYWVGAISQSWCGEQ
jgi:ABC transport system ATP-binding/permease protein